jgi:hypothetical protein
MVNARDSFVMMMYTELTYNSITMNYVYQNPQSPETSKLKLNAVNIFFLSDAADGPLFRTTVSIDIIHDNEFTALTWQGIVVEILRKCGYVKKQDYTTPASPTPQTESGYIYWEANKIKWDAIPDDEYVHLNATFDLVHYVPYV